MILSEDYFGLTVNQIGTGGPKLDFHFTFTFIYKSSHFTFN